MANTNAKIDVNSIKTLLGKDPNGNTVPLKVDTSTGRLLVHITSVANPGDTSQDRPAKADDNGIRTLNGSDGTNTKPLLIDNRNDLLLCVVNIE